MNNQIEEIGLEEPQHYIGFIGTLFLFIVVSNILSFYPGTNHQPVRSPLPQPLLFVYFWLCHFLVLQKQG
jgi:F0F1-type ATP synthase membrane subunit a